MLVVYAAIIALIALVYGITFITESTRKITIQYASRGEHLKQGRAASYP
jgi:preprotein translocase subunit SecY